MVEPEANIVEEVIVGRGQKEAQVEKGFSEECPATSAMAGTSFVHGLHHHLTITSICCLQRLFNP